MRCLPNFSNSFQVDLSFLLVFKKNLFLILSKFLAIFYWINFNLFVHFVLFLTSQEKYRLFIFISFKIMHFRLLNFAVKYSFRCVFFSIIYEKIYMENITSYMKKMKKVTFLSRNNSKAKLVYSLSQPSGVPTQNKSLNKLLISLYSLQQFKIMPNILVLTGEIQFLHSSALYH